MGHNVRTLQTCRSGSETVDVYDEQLSVRPSVLAKTVAEVEQEMLEGRCVTVVSCANRSLNLRNMAGEFYDKGICKMPQ